MAVSFSSSDEPAVIKGFVGRECKGYLHYKCAGNWKGLGFEVKCCCPCHQENTGCDSGDVGLGGQNRQPKSDATRSDESPYGTSK
jgi:hypothetical protein